MLISHLSFLGSVFLLGSINPNGFRLLSRRYRLIVVFLPVTCGNINWKGIEENRDQIFAEAVEMSKNFGLYLQKILTLMLLLSKSYD